MVRQLSRICRVDLWCSCRSPLGHFWMRVWRFLIFWQQTRQSSTTLLWIPAPWYWRQAASWVSDPSAHYSALWFGSYPLCLLAAAASNSVYICGSRRRTLQYQLARRCWEMLRKLEVGLVLRPIGAATTNQVTWGTCRSILETLQWPAIQARAPLQKDHSKVRWRAAAETDRVLNLEAQLNWIDDIAWRRCP